MFLYKIYIHALLLWRLFSIKYIFIFVCSVDCDKFFKEIKFHKFLFCNFFCIKSQDLISEFRRGDLYHMTSFWPSIPKESKSSEILLLNTHSKVLKMKTFQYFTVIFVNHTSYQERCFFFLFSLSSCKKSNHA